MKHNIKPKIYYALWEQVQMQLFCKFIHIFHAHTKLAIAYYVYMGTRRMYMLQIVKAKIKWAHHKIPLRKLEAEIAPGKSGKNLLPTGQEGNMCIWNLAFRVNSSPVKYLLSRIFNVNAVWVMYHRSLWTLSRKFSSQQMVWKSLLKWIYIIYSTYIEAGTYCRRIQ